jgi:hypothetical protein
MKYNNLCFCFYFKLIFIKYGKIIFLLKVKHYLYLSLFLFKIFNKNNNTINFYNILNYFIILL